MLTGERVVRITEPVEQIYMDVSSKLLINLAAHLKDGDLSDPARWEIQKLTELGTLTEESIDIIASSTGRKNDVIRDAIRKAVDISLEDTEKGLAAAAAKSVIQTPSTTLQTSHRVAEVVENHLALAVRDTNLVNTVMLDSTLNLYRQAITSIAAAGRAAQVEQLLTATSLTGVTGKLGAAQRVLNEAALSVTLAGSSQQKAVRNAIRQLANKGITGFVDRAGRQWSPEAYVTMDVRTTVHNAAIQAQRARSSEYGVSTFQISTHPGARPLCAPYQGWICSWDDSGGVVYDFYGREYAVHPISETSYGEAAGIFGINCGHFPNTFISGYSVPRYDELLPEDEAANAKRYEEFQTQRAIERKLRAAKTKALAYDAAGLRDDFGYMAMRIHDLSEGYEDFCELHGLTPRLYRTRVLGYNRSIAAKAAWAASQERLRVQMLATKALPSAAKIHLTPLRLSVQTLLFDAEHIDSRGHHVTEEQAKAWIHNALFSVSVWKGEYERFYSDSGAVYVNLKTGTIRTAYSSNEYDARTRQLIEVYKNAKVRNS